MSFRLLGAPWWVRWAVFTSLLALGVVVVWGLIYPVLDNPAVAGWSAVISLALGGLMAAQQQPKHRAYVAAVSGLSSSERSQAIRAVSGGEIPADPEVLAAAMELADVAAAGRRPGRSIWVLRLVSLALFAVAAVIPIVTGNFTQGVVWAGLGLTLAGGWAWDWYYLRRLRIRYGLICAAARAGD